MLITSQYSVIKSFQIFLFMNYVLQGHESYTVNNFGITFSTNKIVRFLLILITRLFEYFH